jgi:phage terminase large subunit-like protein
MSSLLIDDGVIDTLAMCHKDSKFCAKVLFPDAFRAPFSTLHEQMFSLVDSGAQMVAIAAPRGIGKTTIAKLIANKGILFRDVSFIIYVSNSATMAEMQTENLKRELLINQEVRGLFGDIKVSDYGTEMDESFSKLAWVAYGRTLVLPRGSGQQIRGLNWNNHRPELIIIDDLEDKKEVKNEDIRREQKQWLLSDVMKSVNRYSKEWRIIYIDTLKHEDSVLQMLLDSPEWKSIRLELCDENLHTNDVNYMTDAELAEEYRRHEQKGELDVFYMEYRNLPISTKDAVFKPEYFRYYEEADLQESKGIENVVIVDPAKTIKVHSAESAIVGIGIDTQSQKLYIRDIVHRKLYPDEIINEMFMMADRLHAHAIGVETTSLEEFIKQPIKNEMSLRGKFYELVWLKARGGRSQQSGKEERIAALAPFYRQGFVYHNASCCRPLEAQLLSFPRSALWDVMDATAYIVEMLEMGERYFQPPEETGVMEDEYKDIEYEKPIADWRTL